MRRFAVALLASLAVAVPAAAPAQSQDAASLLALHRQYVGWQFGDGTFTSLYESGTATQRDPHTGTVKTIGSIDVLRVGAVYRDTDVRPVIGTVDNGFTGRLFWESDANGFTRPVYGDAQKANISIEYVLNEGVTSLAGTLESPQTIDGKAYPVVRVSPSDGFPIDLVIDPQTGALKQYRIDPDGDYDETVDVLAYADPISGKRVISSLSVHDSNLTWTYDHFEANVPISTAQLHPPPQTATWTFANPSPFSVTMTPDRVLVDATVNGVKGTFILDTGTAGLLLDQSFADRAHVKNLNSSDEAAGIGGAFATQRRLIDTLTVGGNTLSHVQVTSEDLERFDYRGLDAKGYAGLIGYDLFAGAVVRLNFSNSTMTITDPSTTDLSSEHGIVANVDLSEEIPAIPMTLDGRFLVSTLLDSGTPALVLFSPALVYKDHLGLMRFDTIIGGLGGYEITECGDISSLTIGPITYEHEAGCESGVVSEHQALVGLAFLKHFNIIFDYPQGQMIFEPINT